MRTRILMLTSLFLTSPLSAAPPNGNATIRNRAGDSEIVIKTTSRLAGAIDSLTWNGKEFIDSFDHGRQLQSAASFDCSLPGEFWAERYNPTEAGSRSDGAGPTSSSRLISLNAKGNKLVTRSQLAFWLAPGQKSSGRPALNEKVLSNHRLAKQVQIGYQQWENVIDYRVTFTVPAGEKHNYAQFEALTGYMPAEFNQFWVFDAKSGELKPIDDGPGEQNRPVVLCTKDGEYAMGVFSPAQPSPGFEHAGYGRFRFIAAKVVKWNCVFRLRNEHGIKPGDYSFQVFAIVGNREDVRKTLVALTAAFAKEN